MTAPSFPLAEFGIRAWANTLDLGAASRKILFGKPKGDQLPPAFVVLKQVSSVVEAEMVGVSNVDVQFEAWARGQKAKRTAAEVIHTLEHAVKVLPPHSPLGEEAASIGTEITLGPLWRPDDDAEYGIYVMGCTFLVRPLVGSTA